MVNRTCAHSVTMHVGLSPLLALQDDDSLEFDILDDDNEFRQDPSAWTKKKKQRPGSAGQGSKSPAATQRKMDGFLTVGEGLASSHPLASSLMGQALQVISRWSRSEPEPLLCPMTDPSTLRTNKAYIGSVATY